MIFESPSRCRRSSAINRRMFGTKLLPPLFAERLKRIKKRSPSAKDDAWLIYGDAQPRQPRLPHLQGAASGRRSVSSTRGDHGVAAQSRCGRCADPSARARPSRTIASNLDRPASGVRSGSARTSTGNHATKRFARSVHRGMADRTGPRGGGRRTWPDGSAPHLATGHLDRHVTALIRRNAARSGRRRCIQIRGGTADRRQLRRPTIVCWRHDVMLLFVAGGTALLGRSGRPGLGGDHPRCELVSSMRAVLAMGCCARRDGHHSLRRRRAGFGSGAL